MHRAHGHPSPRAITLQGQHLAGPGWGLGAGRGGPGRGPVWAGRVWPRLHLRPAETAVGAAANQGAARASRRTVSRVTCGTSLRSLEARVRPPRKRRPRPPPPALGHRPPVGARSWQRGDSERRGAAGTSRAGSPGAGVQAKSRRGGIGVGNGWRRGGGTVSAAAAARARGCAAAVLRLQPPGQVRPQPRGARGRTAPCPPAIVAPRVVGRASRERTCGAGGPGAGGAGAGVPGPQVSPLGCDDGRRRPCPSGP